MPGVNETKFDPLERAQRLGRALREARGTMSVVEASNRSGLSRQWWLDAEKGRRRKGDRFVVTELRPESLAKAVIAVGGDIRKIFAIAEKDPTPFLRDDWDADEIAKARRARQVELLGYERHNAGDPEYEPEPTLGELGADVRLGLDQMAETLRAIDAKLTPLVELPAKVELLAQMVAGVQERQNEILRRGADAERQQAGPASEAAQ